MNSGFTFPLALCKAHYGIWLHSLEMFETIGARFLLDGIALTRAETDAVMRAEDWRALAMAPMHAFRRSDTDGVSHTPPVAIEATPSRRAVVNDALRTLHGALAAAPSARRLQAGRKAATTRRKA
jgi:predicted amidohydrolase YtcJ